MQFASADNVIRFDDICPFCLDELRRGIPEDGKCGHESLRSAAADHHPEREDRTR